MKPPSACYYLQNKAYFFPAPRRPVRVLAPGGGSLRGEDEPSPLATPCSCQRTHDAVGPDGGLVSPDACAPGRACFRAEVSL